MNDLQIERRIADIEGVYYIETRYDKNNFLALVSENTFIGTPPEMIGEYSPLTDDALCFKFCWQDDIYVSYTECPAGSGKAYWAVKNGMQTDYCDTPNRAVCMAKLDIFSK